MQERKKWTELSWGLISGTALGLGSSLGWVWQSWNVFFIVSAIIATLMIWYARRLR